MAATFTVPEHIRDILRSATIYIPDKPSPANLHTLTLNGQLARKDYQDVMKVIEGAGGKWDKKRGLHTFQSDPSTVLGLAIDEGKGRNIQQEFQAFYTPPELAAKMAAHLPAKVERVLEPSCGEGALLRAVRKLHPEAFLVGYDINPEALRKCGLGGKGNGMGGPPPKCELEPGYSMLKDFTEATSTIGTFDGICMNPPYTKGQDAQHVLHAMAFLRAGGTLVALMSPNAMTKTTGHYRTLLDELKDTERWHIEHAEEIPAKTFKDTDIATLLVRIKRLA